MNELEEKLAKLQEENSQLSQHLESVSCREETIRSYKREMKLKMGKLLCNSDSPETEIAAVLTQFRQLYEHYGEQRQQEVHFHLAQLERLMLPTKVIKTRRAYQMLLFLHPFTRTPSPPPHLQEYEDGSLDHCAG